MDHIAIDLGSRESQICIRSEKGALLEERRVRTDALRELLMRRGLDIASVDCPKCKGRLRFMRRPSSPPATVRPGDTANVVVSVLM